VTVDGHNLQVSKPLGPFGFFCADINGNTANADRLGQTFAGTFTHLDRMQEQRKQRALLAQTEEEAVAAAAEAEAAGEQDRKEVEEEEEARALAEQEEKVAEEEEARAVAEQEEKAAAEKEAKALAVAKAAAVTAEAVAANLAREKVMPEDLERERLRVDQENQDARQSAKDKAVELESVRLADLLSKLHVLCKAFATPNINTNQATTQAETLLVDTYTDLLKPQEGTQEANCDAQLEVKMVYLMLGVFSTSESAYNMTSIIAARAMVDEVARIFKEKTPTSSSLLSNTAKSLADLAIRYGLVKAPDLAAVTHLEERLCAYKHAKIFSIVARYMGPVDANLRGDVHAMRSKYTRVYKQAHGLLAEILKARADSSGLFGEPSSNLTWAKKAIEIFSTNTDSWAEDNFTALQDHLDMDPLSAARVTVCAHFADLIFLVQHKRIHRQMPKRMPKIQQQRQQQQRLVRWRRKISSCTMQQRGIKLYRGWSREIWQGEKWDAQNSWRKNQ
jgi:chemotaxis protein histidine kinase CheA